MKRRGLMEAAVGITCVTAGCGSTSSADQPGDPRTSTATRSPTAAAAKTAARKISSATDSIDAAADELLTQSEKFESAKGGSFSVDFEESRILTELQSARDSLNTAREDATREQSAVIDTLLGLVDILESTTNSLDEMALGLTHLDNAATHIGNSSGKDSANASAKAEAAFERSRSSLQPAVERLDAIDSSTLNERTDADVAALKSSLESLAGVLSALVAFSDGFEKLGRGFADMMTGLDHLRDERYADAEERFVNARAHITGAESSLAEAEKQAPPEYRKPIVEFTCLIPPLEDAVTHYEKAARLAQREQYSDARSEIEAGNTDLDKVSECSFS